MGPLPTPNPTSGSHYSGNTHRWKNGPGTRFPEQEQKSAPQCPPPQSFHISTWAEKMNRQAFTYTHTHTQPLEPCLWHTAHRRGSLGWRMFWPIKSDTGEKQTADSLFWIISISSNKRKEK